MVRATLRLKDIVTPEHTIQEAVARVLAVEIAAPGRLSKHGVCWIGIDHANFAGLPGVRVARGVVAGVPDLLVQWRERAWWIELKVERGGALNAAQQIALPVFHIASAGVGIARSVEEVLALIDAWGIPRARRVTIAA